MKFVLALITLAAGARLNEPNAMEKVVTLLKDMKTKIASDGESEQTSYDKFACWCEETLSEKAEAITKAKDKLEEIQNRLVKNKGGLGSGGATIEILKKDIADNIASMKEATAVREKEGTSYDEEKVESEQCIGALESAIKVLSGAGGSGKKGFLETLQEARLLSVVGSMRQVLKARVMKKDMKQDDLEVVQAFVNKPEDFMHGKVALGAMQVGNNPFGDYAPQSSRIQGILKSMYDSFTGDLEKDNAEEGEKQKAYLELKAIKESELEKLETDLTTTTKTAAEKTKQVADDKAMRTTTQEQLASDEDFFKQTKVSCEEKAKHWAQRSRSRTLELSSLSEAVEILESDEAKGTFKDSTAMFLQISSKRAHRKGDKRTKAYQQIKTLAARYNSLKLAQIAVVAKSTGHFDDVIVMIDKMITTLRAEEAEDIAHRDRCEGKQDKNKNDKEDAESRKTAAEAEIKRLEEAITNKEEEIKTLDKEMEANTKTQGEIKTQRETETEEFKKAQKADEDALVLLQKAKDALGKYYKNTDAFIQKAEPQPETNWQGGERGSKGEARGVIAILDMLMEDINKELKSQGQDEIDSQTDYEKERLSLTMAFRAAEKSKVAALGEKADLGSKKDDETGKKETAEDDIKTEEDLAADIKLDCDWVESNFETRREKRKAEIEGLAGAKDFLAGAGSDSDLEMP